MTDKKTYKDLKITPYELSELDYLQKQKYGHYSNTSYDYGTGDEYTPVEVHFVTRIYLNPGMTVKEMSQLTKRTRSAVSQTVSKLEKRGLIKRETHPRDARQICLYATEAGEQLSKMHIEFDDRFYGGILDKVIEKFGFEAVENYISVLSFLFYGEY